MRRFRGMLMKKLFDREQRQELAEYALLVSLIALVAIACVTLLGDRIDAIVASVRTVF